MPRYVLDDYVQEHPPDDAVNANCVASWRASADAANLYVDLHNRMDLRRAIVARRRAGTDPARTAKK